MIRSCASFPNQKQLMYALLLSARDESWNLLLHSVSTVEIYCQQMGWQTSRGPLTLTPCSYKQTQRPEKRQDVRHCKLNLNTYWRWLAGLKSGSFNIVNAHWCAAVATNRTHFGSGIGCISGRSEILVSNLVVWAILFPTGKLLKSVITSSELVVFHMLWVTLFLTETLLW